MTTENAYFILDSLIKQNKSFAIYRMPGQAMPGFVMQSSGSPSLFQDIKKLDGQEGFVIAPFSISKKSPIILIHPDCTSLQDVEIRNYSDTEEKTGCKEALGIDKKAYAQLFNKFLEPLTKGEMEKLVLSRNKTISKGTGFSPGRSFYQAAKKYIYSYVYLFHTPQSGTWLGSTPEILLSGANQEWKTISLAGTLYPNSGVSSWDEKNLREQAVVSSYLTNQLADFGISSETTGPYTVKAGDLEHLRTDFNFRLTDTSKLGTLLKALHPTPAISGLPKKEAYEFIQKNEGYDRLYYSGFLGMLNAKKQTDIYVNLRCMHIEKSSLTLFAGGGLLASSSLDEEWEETEHKLKTMFGILK